LGAAASVVQPPKEYNATNMDFPTLGGPPAAAAMPPVQIQMSRKQKQKGAGTGGGTGGGPPAVLAPPRSREEAVMRNRLLMQSLAEAVLDSGRPDGLLEFKALSVGYQQGEIGADSYVEGFVGLLGGQISSRLFPEVAQLLPDPAKRVELSSAFERFNLQALQPPRTSPQPAGALPGLGGGETPAGRGRGRGRGRGQVVG